MNNIKFSIIIPTHNRPELLAVVVKHAMQLDYPSFEVIVSDNSSEETMRRNNDEVVSEYLSQDNFRIVRPLQLLSPPEHFEFALDFASGDYVLYLTDKMMILPHILSLAAEAISASGAEIVNWATAAHQIDDAKNPAGSGTLTVSSEFLEGRPELYDPQAALSFKASCIVPRDKQQSKDYVIGKIIFGCYSKELIKRIRDKTGTVFNGATHDYSAMIQGLSLAKSCVMLNTYGAIFITLPPDESWGSLINTYAQQALNYYKSFKNTESILDSLMIPGLYASQHNMVAHDYKKFMPLYGNASLFNERNWLLAIYTDLVSPSKVWRDAKEKKVQLRLLISQIRMRTHINLYILYKRDSLFQLWDYLSSRYRSISRHLPSCFRPPKTQISYQTIHMKTLSETIEYISENSRAAKQGQILCLYSANQTYTETVFEHLDSFRLYSTFQWSYLHWKQLSQSSIDLEAFDAIVVHYTIRLPFDQMEAEMAELLNNYSGIKILFIQDEYDNTNRAKHWIKAIGFNLVFSVVPEKNLRLIYKPEEFPSCRFVNVLTGYMPTNLMRLTQANLCPPSVRPLVVGYRARPLPIRYGALGLEKVLIGQMVKEYCVQHQVAHDIAWSEESRIYGEKWYEFITSCKAMLGSESGSNVFDWDGDLTQLVELFKKEHPTATEQDVYRQLIAPLEMPGFMNQISPRIFESIACRTVLVLFEGDYSGVIKPWIHFIPLKKDGSNLSEVFAKLQDNSFVDEMATRAYEDIIASSLYGYRDFVHRVDSEINSELSRVEQKDSRTMMLINSDNPNSLTTTSALRFRNLWWQKRLQTRVWAMLPLPIKALIKPVMKKILNVNDAAQG